MKVKVAQSCLTLCDPKDYTVHGILQPRILEWVSFPFSRGSSQPRERTQVSHTAGRFSTSWATGEAHTRLRWAPNPMTSVLIRRQDTQRHIQGWKATEECGRDWSYAATRKTKDVQAPSEAERLISSLETWSCWCSDFTLLASGIVKRIHFCCFKHLVGSNLLQQPREMSAVY